MTTCGLAALNTGLLALALLLLCAPYLACAWLLLRAKRATDWRPPGGE